MTVVKLGQSESQGGRGNEPSLLWPTDRHTAHSYGSLPATAQPWSMHASRYFHTVTEINSIESLKPDTDSVSGTRKYSGSMFLYKLIVQAHAVLYMPGTDLVAPVVITCNYPHPVIRQ